MIGQKDTDRINDLHKEIPALVNRGVLYISGMIRNRGATERDIEETLQ
jgi:hypothetical protein